MSTKIKSFLEFAVYYKRFRQGFSSIVAPLTRITRKEGHFVWTNRYKQSFRTLKERLTTVLVLSLLAEHDDLVVYSDMSGIRHVKVLMHSDHLCILTNESS